VIDILFVSQTKVIALQFVFLHMLAPHFSQIWFHIQKKKGGVGRVGPGTFIIAPYYNKIINGIQNLLAFLLSPLPSLVVNYVRLYMSF